MLSRTSHITSPTPHPHAPLKSSSLGTNGWIKDIALQRLDAGNITNNIVEGAEVNSYIIKKNLKVG